MMHKLARIADEAEKFLTSFSEDLKLDKAEWVADSFRTGSVSFTANYVGAAENGDDETPKTKIKFKPLEISKNGLELIEFVSLDCTNKEGVWKSDVELKIDKNSFVILNNKKTKEFWKAKIFSEKQPKRVKVRNIAGDESIIEL
jgi:hypothetical protein